MQGKSGGRAGRSVIKEKNGGDLGRIDHVSIHVFDVMYCIL